MADEIDALYELAPGEFTAARNALAARLKKDGKAERADEVKALAKPTAAAHVVNQLSRAHPDKLRELAKAGEALRKAQRALLKGEGREAFQAAVARERTLVAELTQLAHAFSESAAVLARVTETLHAAGLGEEAAEQVLSARLSKELTPPVFGGAGAATARAEPAPKPKEPEAEREARKAEAAADRAAKKADAAEARAEEEDSQRAAAEARAQRAAAKKAEAEARRAARRAEAEARARARAEAKARAETEARQAREAKAQARELAALRKKIAALEKQAHAAEARAKTAQEEARRRRLAVDEMASRIRALDTSLT